MKKSIIVLCSIALLFCSVTPALAWGDEGHQTVGKIASLRIARNTSRRIAQILTQGETLASISTWADSVKDRMGTSDPDPDTNQFLQDLVHNEKNREWHYDDLPLDCSSYQSCTGFTPANDVIHMVNICIRTLQGNPDPAQPLSKRNALRLLVHFLGDMHQPLHIGAGYINENGPNHRIVLATNPQQIRNRNLPSDRGGNQLIIDRDRKRLHSFWDFDLVRSLMAQTNRSSSDELGLFLRQTIAPQPNWEANGPVSTWAAKWATDSLLQSRMHTYRSVRIVGKRTIPVLRDGQPLVRNGRPVTEVVYDVILPANYKASNRALVRRQLAKGGYRLAKLLDTIFAQ